ncbi:MAG TPA: hypothetical protein VG323_08580 [Thermoanaerobaculia bacterium]|nr:hypothetical protein [Thermoanaerobaculia bacterium]
MKRIVAVVAFAIVAFGGYRYWSTSVAPERHYKQFAEELLHRRYDAAAAMTDGLSKNDVERAGTQEKIGAGPAMFQTLFPSKFAVTSREAAPDGALVLHAVQTVLFNPPGVESALRPAMFAEMNQTVTLRKTADGWKVAAFENKFGRMDSLTRR